jgi:hypothetical protein
MFHGVSKSNHLQLQGETSYVNSKVKQSAKTQTFEELVVTIAQVFVVNYT